jgi:hypothetical protein
LRLYGLFFKEEFLNEIVHAVPMLDEVQILLDLAPQRQEVQVIAPVVMNVGFNQTPWGIRKRRCLAFM